MTEEQAPQQPPEQPEYNSERDYQVAKEIKDDFTKQFAEARKEWTEAMKFVTAKNEEQQKEIETLKKEREEDKQKMLNYQRLAFTHSTAPQYSVPTAEDLYNQQIEMGIDNAIIAMKIPKDKIPEFKKTCMQYIKGQGSDDVRSRR